MKFDFQDYPLLSTLHYQDIAEYLSSRGWEKLATNPGKFSIWEYIEDEENNFDILLPLNQKFKDYERRILEILNTLEKVEKRQQTEIFKDLQMMSGINSRSKGDDIGSSLLNGETSVIFSSKKIKENN